MEEQMWSTLGLRSGPENLADRDWQQVDDYQTIIAMRDRERVRRERAASSGGAIGAPRR